MERSTTSRGSGDSGGGRDLRFRYESCYCKKNASLRIVRSLSKPSRGRLYFVCEGQGCDFFRWCEPIEPIDEDDDDSTCKPSLGEILASIEENNRAIRKLIRSMKLGFGFLVVVFFVCVLKLI